MSADCDRLGAKTAQLKALTACLYGEGFDEFRRMADDVQQNVMWLVHDLADEVEELAQRVMTAAARASREG